MNTIHRKALLAAIGFLAAFFLWTAAVCCIDVAPIGPLDSSVGCSALNRFVHELTGVNMALYALTDWLDLVPIATALGFAMLGGWQWLRRRNPFKVDFDILALGGFYTVVLGAYVFFEVVPINFRPVLIEGILEASYPSSSTLLACTVMPTAILQLRKRVRGNILRRVAVLACAVFAVGMVAGRLLSGVHWVSDIIGGILLSAGLVAAYCAVCKLRMP